MKDVSEPIFGKGYQANSKATSLVPALRSKAAK
jgi:hypothetical protein